MPPTSPPSPRPPLAPGTAYAVSFSLVVQASTTTTTATGRRLAVAESILMALQSAIASAIGGLRPSDVLITSVADTSIDVTVLIGLLGSSPSLQAVQTAVAAPAFIASVNQAATGVDVIAVQRIRTTTLAVSPPPPPIPSPGPSTPPRPPPTPGTPSFITQPLYLTLVINGVVAIIVLLGCCCLLSHLARRYRPQSRLDLKPGVFDEIDTAPRRLRREPSLAPPAPPPTTITTPPVPPPSSSEVRVGKVTGPDDPVNRPSSPVPDEVLRVFQWFQTGPMPYAIDVNNLRAAHRALGVDVSGAQLAAALARYDVRRKGRLELAEVRILIALPLYPVPLYSPAASPAPRPRTTATRLATLPSSLPPLHNSQFRTLIEQLRPLDEVARIFKLIDRDYSGDIDVGELHIGMHLLGLEGSTTEAKQLLARFDRDKSSKIELDEFRALVDDLRRFKASAFDEVARTFHKFDHDRSHTIDTSELRAALYSLGLVADDKHAMLILTKYDASRNGALEFDEFKRLVDDLRAYQAHASDDVVRVFLAFDRDRSGSIDKRELAAALDELGLETDSTQAASILARYDRDRSGVLELGEFRTLCEELQVFQATARKDADAGGPNDEIRAIFVRYDADNSGDIDVRELSRALDELGLVSDTAQAALILDQYDTDRSRKLELPEFRRLITSLREFHSKADDDTGRIFRRFDVDASNSIEKTELSAALYALGLGTDAAEVSRILERYDKDGNGALDASEFRALVADLRAFQFRRTDGGGYRDDDPVHSTFVRYDRDGSNTIDNAELRDALGALGLSSTGAQAEAIMLRYDRDRSGHLDLGEFRELVFNLRRYTMGAPSTQPHFEHGQPPPPVGPKVIERVIVATDDIHRIFLRYDRDANNKLDVKEVPAAMAELGLQVATHEAAPIIQQFDKGSKGVLELDEFRELVHKLRAYQAVPHPLPEGGRFPAQKEAAAETVGSVFRRFDKDNSGDIDVHELEEALNALGMRSDTHEARSVLARYDTDKNGKLDKQEFRSLVKELKKFQQTNVGAAPPAAPPPRPPQTDVSASEAERVFREFDTDKSGDIDVRELRGALNALGVSADTDAAEGVLQRFDGGTGTLNFDQFRQLIATLQKFQAAAPSRGD